MEFSDVVRRRRMVRNYDPDRPIPPDILERLLTNATHAPSAGYAQGWAFLVLQTPEELADFWAAATPKTQVWQEWLTNMRNAPLIIVPFSHKNAYLDRYAEADKGWTDRDEARWPVPYWDIDTGMASLLVLLTAVDEGLGACFFGIPPAQREGFQDHFGVPTEFVPIGAISVGYRRTDHKSKSHTRGRRTLDEVVHYGRWR